MNITDLRRRPRRHLAPLIAPPEPPPAGETSQAEEEYSLDLFRVWLHEFAQMHQVCVTVLDEEEALVAGPMQEPIFCREAKRHCPGGCPRDCGRSEAVASDPRDLVAFRCPYNLSNVAFRVRSPGGEGVWAVVLGHTLAVQAQLAECMAAVRGVPEIPERTLASLGAIPWTDERHLTEVGAFLRSSMDLIFKSAG